MRHFLVFFQPLWCQGSCQGFHNGPKRGRKNVKLFLGPAEIRKLQFYLWQRVSSAKLSAEQSYRVMKVLRMVYGTVVTFPLPWILLCRDFGTVCKTKEFQTFHDRNNIPFCHKPKLGRKFEFELLPECIFLGFIFYFFKDIPVFAILSSLSKNWTLI